VVVTPWLKKKTVELIGKEESYFINMVLKKLRDKETPKQLEEHLEKVLSEDTEVIINQAASFDLLTRISSKTSTDSLSSNLSKLNTFHLKINHVFFSGH
jgi:hypothetical protein